jgi:hypothetical protein
VGTAVVLPVGLWCDGTRTEEAVVRPMTGADQEFLMDAGAGMLPARRTSAILARCVQRIGAEAPISPEVAGRLVVGDREALMLHVRQMTFGDKLEPLVRCPRVECGQQMDVSLRISDLLVAPSPGAVPEYFERDFPGFGTVRFRLPCGRDQEAVAALARSDPAAAARTLLGRCMDQPVEELPAGAVEVIGGWMGDLDPQAEIRLDLACPECGRVFTSVLDAGAYLFEETALRSRELYWQVHVLASRYHWSEAEILGMTPPRRRRYIDLLLDAFPAGDGAP